MEFWCIRITVVGHKDPLEENVLSGGYPVTEGGLYDEQFLVDDGIDPKKAENHHRCVPNLLSVSPIHSH